MFAKVIHQSKLDKDPIIPTQMGTPSENQFQGKQFDKLVEIAGRVCYDSFGKGRSSKDYHAHLLDVGHNSVHEHVVVSTDRVEGAEQVLMGRPGVWLHQNTMYANLRALIEWGAWSELKRQWGHNFNYGLSQLCVIKFMHALSEKSEYLSAYFGDSPYKFEDLSEPQLNFISVYFEGSRGFSHEQVRHRFAISQRSTRYVDEADSPWDLHPLIQKDRLASGAAAAAIAQCKFQYRSIVDQLSKKYTRKEARGAARGVLGNALQTQMIVTAPYHMWEHMFKMRMSKFADDEIRMIYSCLAEDKVFKAIPRTTCEKGGYVYGCKS